MAAGGNGLLPVAVGTSDCLAVGDFRVRLLSSWVALFCRWPRAPSLSFGAGTSDCLAVGTCLRAFFQVGLLPVAVGSFPLLPGPHFASLLVTSVCAFFQVPVAASSFLLLPGPSLCLPLVTSLRALFQVGWLRSTGGRELLPVAAGTSLCLPLVTSLRAFFQAGFLPVAASSFLLLPGPRSAWSVMECPAAAEAIVAYLCPRFWMGEGAFEPAKRVGGPFEPAPEVGGAERGAISELILRATRSEIRPSACCIILCSF